MSFISFSYLIFLPRTSSTMLNRSGTSRHSCLIPDLRRKISKLSSLYILLAIDFCRCALSDWGSFFLSLVCWVFYHERVLDLTKFFFCIYWDDHVVFLFLFLFYWYGVIHFWMLTWTCITEIKPTWSWCAILFTCSSIWFASILLRIFVLICIRDIGLYLSLWYFCLLLVSG